MSEAIPFELQGYCPKMNSMVLWDDCETCDCHAGQDDWSKVVQCEYEEMEGDKDD